MILLTVIYQNQIADYKSVYVNNVRRKFYGSVIKLKIYKNKLGLLFNSYEYIKAKVPGLHI